MMELVFDAGAIVLADLILSGDNALIIGMTAAVLSPELRARAIVLGMGIAAMLRVFFAIVATKLLALPGLLFVGGLLLGWVCLRLYREIRRNMVARAEPAVASGGNADAEYAGSPRRSLVSALWTITLADASMSLDNVLAVAAIAEGHVLLLVFGLGLAIVLMASAATLIMKLLTHFPWISWLGLAVLTYVAGEMLFRGFFDVHDGIGPMLGLVDGMHLGNGH